MKLSDKIKIAVLAYWKFEKHHMMGAIECKSSDVFTVSRTYMTTETEVKVSITDMQREIKTKSYKHSVLSGRMLSGYDARQAHYFYFALPAELREKALEVINQRYPYAGLLVFTDGHIDVFRPLNIAMIRHSKRFKRVAVSLKELLELGYAATNTTLKFASKLNGLGNEVESDIEL